MSLMVAMLLLPITLLDRQWCTLVTRMQVRFFWCVDVRVYVCIVKFVHDMCVCV